MRQLPFWILVGLLFLAKPVQAQVVTTGPITTNHRAAWEQSNEISLTTAQALVYRMRVDGAVPFTVVASVVCAVFPTQVNTFTCSANIPQAVVDKVNLRGSHTLTLRAFDGTTESPDSLPFVLTVPPAAPGNLRVVTVP